MKRVHKPSAIPVYGVAALWLLWALILPLYRLWHFVLLAALSVGAWFVLKRIFPGREYDVEEPAAPTGNSELDEAVAQGRDAMARMRSLNRQIEDPHITWQLDQMETVTARIFDQVTAHPDLLPQIRKFMSYYLPTTLKLLESYHELDASGAEGAEVQESKQRIRGMLDTVLKAFQHQLDALFNARTMDINAEVQVLETMMAAEGMTSTQSDGGLHL